MEKNSLTPKELEAIRHIRNALVHRGQAPSVRELQAALGYRSPRSASDILERLLDRGIVRRRGDGRLQLIHDPEEERGHARTVDVPIVGAVPCGPLLLAEENVEASVPVSVRLARLPHRYFLLRASGDSMNEAGINDGDLVLVRQQATAENGDRVVALVDGEATIKQFHRGREAVLLRPKSTNKKHKPIVLSEDFVIQGVVVSTVPRVTAE
jgi:repressor LexA